MPFQSEKQRRFLHANHPEIAKRWEREYATGGISNHFRRKFFTGALADTQGPAGGQAMSPGTSTSGGTRHGGGGGNGGHTNNNTPPTHPIHTGPTAAELAARKAAADAKAKAIAQAEYKNWWDATKAKKKEKVKHHKTLTSKFDTPTWDTNINMMSVKDLYDPTATLEDYINKLDDDKTLNYFEQQHMKELEFQNRTKFEDEFKKDFDDDTPGGPDIPKREQRFQKLAGLTKKQKQALDTSQRMGKDFGNFTNEQILENIQMWDDPDDPATIKDIEKFYSAKGGVARKNYFHGGILDIDASEEIISDDGNDIELTAYNAEFDDPKDLSTGVKTLFQAKDGGRIGYANGPPGGGETSLGSGAAYSGSTNRERGIQQAYSQPAYSPTGDASVAEKIAADDRKRKQQLKNLVETGPGSDWEKYDTDLVDMKGEPVMTPEENYRARRNMIKSKYTGTSTQRKNALNKNYNTEKARLEKAMNKKIFKIFGLAFLGKPPTLSSLIDFDPFAEKKLTGILPEAYALEKLKEQHIGDLTDIKESLLAGVDINNPNEMANLDDTVFPDVMKELKELTKKREEDDPEPDGPELPQVVPVHEEIDAYAQSDYYMSPWERMKANQAKRAMLVEKGIIQENPIVDESVTDITMEANRGGLANLFRVKNQ